MVLGESYEQAVQVAQEHHDEGMAYTLKLIADAAAKVEQRMADLIASETEWHATLRALYFWEPSPTGCASLLDTTKTLSFRCRRFDDVTVHRPNMRKILEPISATNSPGFAASLPCARIRSCLLSCPRGSTSLATPPDPPRRAVLGHLGMWNRTARRGSALEE